MAVSGLLLFVVGGSIVVVIVIVVLIIVLTSRKGGVSNQKSYDRSRLDPVIRASICTGEKVAGFRDRQTGHFSEVMLIRTDADIQHFRQMYNITGSIETIY